MKKVRRGQNATQRSEFHRYIFWILVLSLTGLFPAEAKEDCGDLRSHVVALDSTGIGDWSFLNPRRPFKLFGKESGDAKKYLQCLGETGLIFDAMDTDRSFVVTIKFDLDNDKKSIQAVAKELEQVGKRLVEVKKAIEEMPAVSVNLFGEDYSRLKSESDLLQKQFEVLREVPDSKLPSSPSASGDLSEEEMVKELREKGKLVSSVYLQESLPFVGIASEDHVCTELEATLQETQLGAKPSPGGVAAALRDIKASLKHVSGHLQRLLALRAYPAIFEVKKNCKPKSKDILSCSVKIPVYGLTRPEISGPVFEILARNQPRGIMEFNVSFFDQEDTPANAMGYVQVGPKVSSPPSRFNWQAVFGVGWTRDPEVDPDPDDDDIETITAARPYTGDDRNRFPGSARIDLTGWLSNRARARASLAWKGTDLGSGAGSEVKVSTWSGDVFTDRGFTFRFGNLKFASPSESIAVSARGEGLQLSFRQFGLTHIVNQESSTGKANDDNEDSETNILQAVNLPLNTIFLRTIDLLAQWGESIRENRTPYRFKTYGLETRFAGRNRFCGWPPKLCLPDKFAAYEDLKTALKQESKSDPFTTVSGSLAGYYSERKGMTFTPPENDPDFTDIADGRGAAALLTLNFSRLRYEIPEDRNTKKERGLPRLTPKATVTLKFGYGTGDDPTSSVNEGYLGETASFNPDRLFLRSFAGKLEADAEPLAPGLSNKRYSALFLTFHNAPLLQGLTRIFNEEDLLKPVMTISAQHYRFVESVFDRSDAGLEVGLTLKGEVPEGATASINLSRFWVGNALDSLIEDDPWSISAAVSLTIK